VAPERTAQEIAGCAQEVRERIALAAARSGRGPSQVTLITVTKGHPLETILRALQAGLSCFGENYVEEARPKMDALLDQPVEWHMIGHVQSRKAREVAQGFALVHSVDSLHLARRLDRWAQGRESRLPILLECNVSGETRKYGLATAQREQWEQRLAEIRETAQLPHLQLRGLMTMAPSFADPQETRPVFRRLRELRDWLHERLEGAELGELSMGMSDDFEIAVEEGATMVRLGRALLGPRPPEERREAL
jgi:pyridoxal phosphate enzyme (YggS family)